MAHKEYSTMEIREFLLNYGEGTISKNNVALLVPMIRHNGLYKTWKFIENKDGDEWDKILIILKAFVDKVTDLPSMKQNEGDYISLQKNIYHLCEEWERMIGMMLGNNRDSDGLKFESFDQNNFRMGDFDNKGLFFERYLIPKNENNDKSHQAVDIKYNKDAALIGFLRNKQNNLFEYFKGDGGIRVECQIQNKLVTGLGNADSAETSIDLHTVYGVPYLKSQKIKGVFRKYCEKKGLPTEQINRWFGSEEQPGTIRFFDAYFLPKGSDQLELKQDVMAVHYSKYYQSQTFPGDKHNVIPIFYYVLKNLKIDIYMVTTLDKKEVEALFLECLNSETFGAKGTSGFGRIVPIKEYQIPEGHTKIPVRVVTPMLSHGAGDRNAEIRVEEFRAAMRFWWRAVNRFENGKLLYQKEAELFGSAEKKSPFTLYLDQVKESGVPQSVYLNSKNPLRISGFSQGDKFDLYLISSKDIYVSLIELVSYLGGIGRRSRKGYGVFSIGQKEDLLQSVFSCIKKVNQDDGRYQINQKKNTITLMESDKKRWFTYPQIEKVVLGKEQPLDRFLKYCPKTVKGVKKHYMPPLYVSCYPSNKGGMVIPIITLLSFKESNREQEKHEIRRSINLIIENLGGNNG